jgi:predicted amidophosphoribosyltransferase
MSACEAESLDGHEHTGDVTEYVAVCVRGHERRGLVCSACARPLRHRGPTVARCAECPDDDPRPRILVPAEDWDALASEEER